MNNHRNTLPGPDDITREVLPNGIAVLVRENFTSKAVVLSGSLMVGSVLEDPALQGLSSVVATSLMRGTQHRDFDTIHESLEGIGASLGISGGTHSTSFGGKSLAEDLPVLLNLLADAVRYPAFPVDQVERLRGEMLTGIKIRQQDSRSMAMDAFRKLCYPSDHPYSRVSITELDTLPKITFDHIHAFHNQYYGPRRMIIVIVGAVHPTDAIEMVRRAFGDWENPDQPVYTVPAAPRATEVRTEYRTLAGKTQSDLVMGWPGPARTSPDFQAVNLANSILGVFGMMGRLGKTVREDQGLAYYCGSRLAGGHGPAPWQITAGVNPENVEQAVRSILHEVERMTDTPVSENDLADNKATFIGRLPLNLESNEGVAGSILNMETYGLGLNYLRTYEEMLNAITVADVQAAARRYMSASAYSLAVAGPALG